MRGIPPTWSSSAKDLVSTALGPSRLWVTLGYGIVNEVYWPSNGQPQIRDLGFIVTSPSGWHEVKRVRRYTIDTPDPAIPLPLVRHQGDDYALELELLPDPLRDVLLIRYQLQGNKVKLYSLLAPHLGPNAADNTAWVGNGLDTGLYDGLYASGGDDRLCLLADEGFARASAGFVGVDDGWQDFSHHGRMTLTNPRAEHGNVALMGELAHNEGVLALGFAETVEGARTLARSSLAAGFDVARSAFMRGWQRWCDGLDLARSPKAFEGQARRSAMVLRVHEDKAYPGAVVASLSIPWGNSHDDLGGYHLVWARDAVEAGLGLLASGQPDEARRMLAYLIATQQPDGHWTQNFYPDGRPFWTGIQLDEVGFPILLAAALDERDLLDDLTGVGPMIAQAAGYLARHGPVSPQDRWEENAGASPFTLAVEIAALVAAAKFLPEQERAYALALADCWNERIEEWTYVTGTALAREHGVEGYYLRIAPPADAGGLRGRVQVRNRPGEVVDASALISLDFLYLARLGLRRADDPRLRDTLKVCEAVLRVDTPCGPAYHRYNGDGYGEHEDGRPFDGTGIGRAWPLLTGERGHYALQLGEDPRPYLAAMTCMTGPGGLIPEQVWDADPIPERGLFPGKPTGSAMPLVWAHAEFVKLLFASLRGRPLELLEAVHDRYGGRPPKANSWYWRTEAPFDALPPGRQLVIEDRQPFVLHWGTNGWQNPTDTPSKPLGLGMHGVRLEPDRLAGTNRFDFTRYYPVEQRWESRDHRIALTARRP